MTTAQFIAAVEAKPQFVKWASEAVNVETIGGIEKHMRIAYINTPDGTNLMQVWYIVDSATGNTTWQTGDTIEPEKNTVNVKFNALKAYLKATFAAHFVGRTDLDNNWAEADVYTVSGADLAKSTVLVYKIGNNPITHKKIV